MISLYLTFFKSMIETFCRDIEEIETTFIIKITLYAQKETKKNIDLIDLNIILLVNSMILFVMIYVDNILAQFQSGFKSIEYSPPFLPPIQVFKIVLHVMS